MKRLFVLSVLLLSVTLHAQPNTEVFLLDINEEGGKIEFSNLRNISNNEGYDNQPSFYDDNTVLFSATRNGQTDIAKYDIESEKTSWLTDTPGGSEYSPLRIPDSDAISAIRLDTSGLQRLYRYSISKGTSAKILNDLKVGYHVWMDKETLISSVLVENGMDLVVSDLKENSHTTVAIGVGRSLHKIPDQDLIGFIKFEDDPFSIQSLNPQTGSTNKIVSLMGGISDICWLPDGTILMPDGNTVSRYNPDTNGTTKLSFQFEAKGIRNITRMAVSRDGKHLVLVSDAPFSTIVQKQVTSFNATDLDAFAACYSEDVLVANFPNDTVSVGNKALKAGYKRYFENNPKTTVEVVKRIQIGNTVIDEEIVSKAGRTHRQAAIYTIVNAKIASMTFVHEKEVVPGVEAIIEKNLKAYRARDIDAFLKSYTDDVKVYMFPNLLSYTGKEKMRSQYSDFLKNAEGLRCEIKNRVVIGNILIDEEYLNLNGNHHSAVAIYEIENGKIAKVTFIQ